MSLFFFCRFYTIERAFCDEPSQNDKRTIAELKKGLRNSEGRAASVADFVLGAVGGKALPTADAVAAAAPEYAAAKDPAAIYRALGGK